MRYLALLALASCSVNAPDFASRPVLAESVLDGDPTAAMTPGPFTGRFRVMHGTTACKSGIAGQGNPMVWPQSDRPTAGQPLRIDWTTNPTAPYEPRPALLMVWFDRTPSPVDMTAFGYDGCLLHAPTKLGLVQTMTPKDGTMLTQSGGMVSLNWTPGPQWVGRKLFSQLVVYSPGANGKGWLLSPGLELWVGNQ